MTSGSIVSQQQLAALLSMTVRQVANLEAAGMPVIRDGRRPAYNAPACIAWYVAFKIADNDKRRPPEDFEEARTRKVSAEAELAEIELATQRGQLVPVAEVEAEVGRILDALRAKLMAIPGKYGPMLVGCKTIAESTGRLEPAIQDAMLDLSRTGEEAGEP